MLLRLFCLLVITSIYSPVFSMKIEYQYGDCEQEHHTGVKITLADQDTNPNVKNMQSNYNRLGAAIIRGANEEEQRYVDICNIKDKNLDFVRALMQKTYEIATEREIPLTLNFYGIEKVKHEILSTEWVPFQKEIDKFYVNPYRKYSDNGGYLSD